MHINAQTQVDLDRKAVCAFRGSDQHVAITTSITISISTSIVLWDRVGRGGLGGRSPPSLGLHWTVKPAVLWARAWRWSVKKRGLRVWAWFEGLGVFCGLGRTLDCENTRF